MTSWLTTESAISAPRFGHAWTDAEGAHATVYLDAHDVIIIDTPDDGRAVIAALAKAVEAMEALTRPCPECAAVPPGHTLECTRREVPAYAAGGGGA